MKADLYFGLELKYLRTEYEPLRNLVITEPKYDYDSKTYLWLFKYKDIEKVEAITGTIEIEGLRGPFSKQEVPTVKFKGKDLIEIKEFPKIYQILEHRKQEDLSIKEIRHNVDRDLVKRIWDKVIVHQPLNKPIKTSTIAEKICKELGITRFDRASGSFQFDKFFGARAAYRKYLYYPMKVLHWQGKVIHHKNGTIERAV